MAAKDIPEEFRVPVDKTDMTAKQLTTFEVRLADLRSKLGVRLGKARNMPCPCGSGKKVKRCCGQA